MRTRFYNARVLTMEKGKDIFLGEVWVSGDKITFAGTAEEAEMAAEDAAAYAAAEKAAADKEPFGVN